MYMFVGAHMNWIGDTLITHFVTNIAVQVIWIHDNVVEGDWLHSIDRPVLFHFNSKFNKDIKYLCQKISECTTLPPFVWFQYNRFNKGIKHSAIKIIGSLRPSFLCDVMTMINKNIKHSITKISGCTASPIFSKYWDM